MYRLGEEYCNDAIKRRIYERGSASWLRYADYRRSRNQMQDFQPRRYRFIGSFKKAKKHTGLYTLYLHYCYLLGYFPKNNQHRPLSPEMQEAWRRIDRITRQVRLIAQEKLHTAEDVHAFITETDKSIDEITTTRTQVYNKLRRCHDEDRREELFA